MSLSSESYYAKSGDRYFPIATVRDIDTFPCHALETWLHELITITCDIPKESQHALDLLLRPQALIMHPTTKSKLIAAIPDIESRYVIVTQYCLDEGIIYLIDRKKLEFPYEND